MDSVDKSNEIKDIYDNSNLSVQGVSLEEFEKIFVNLGNVFYAIEKEVRGILAPLQTLAESIDVDKYNRFVKHQKRVKNRKILYAKRKHKYGK